MSFQGNDFVGVRPPSALDELPDLGGGIVTEAYAGGTVRVTTFERTLDRKRETGKLVKPWNLVVPERVIHRSWADGCPL